MRAFAFKIRPSEQPNRPFETTGTPDGRSAPDCWSDGSEMSNLDSTLKVNLCHKDLIVFSILVLKSD